jgi:hypothetical protein
MNTLRRKFFYTIAFGLLGGCLWLFQATNPIGNIQHDLGAIQSNAGVLGQ